MSDISLEAVTKTYAVGTQQIRALDDVTVGLRSGAMTVVLGPSGSGKSTALNLLGGMDSPSAGVVRAYGREIGAMSERELTRYRREHVGFVFQHYNLIPNLTAAENVGIGSQHAPDPVDPSQALSSVGLDARDSSFPSELSGGQMQRVAIARALAKRPQLLLCDEPTGALDSGTGRAVVALLRDIADSSGTAVVVVTHNAGIAAVADDVITLHDGRVASHVQGQVPARVEEVDW
jgi:putative ABC transport system ATP-binding protein